MVNCCTLTATQVVKALDQPEFLVEDPEGLQMLVNAYNRATDSVWMLLQKIVDIQMGNQHGGV